MSQDDTTIKMLEKDLKKAEKDFTKVKKKLENEVNELQVHESLLITLHLYFFSFC